MLVVLNCTPVPRHDYRVGVPRGGVWREILNTDAAAFGGSGIGNLGTVIADDIPFHARPASLRLTLPPLAALYLAPGALIAGRGSPEPELQRDAGAEGARRLVLADVGEEDPGPQVDEVGERGAEAEAERVASPPPVL